MVKTERAGRSRGPEKMPMAALQLPCRTCVLSASLRLALDIFQARLAREPLLGSWAYSCFYSTLAAASVKMQDLTEAWSVLMRFSKAKHRTHVSEVQAGRRRNKRNDEGIDSPCF